MFLDSPNSFQWIQKLVLLTFFAVLLQFQIIEYLLVHYIVIRYYLLKEVTLQDS